jgi:copper resistance protein C
LFATLPETDGPATLSRLMEPSRHRRTLPAVGVLLVALLLGVPATVSAHAELTVTSPADGETLASPPTEVVAIFSEGLNIDRSAIDLLLANSVMASSGGNPDDPTRLVLSDLDLEAGEYEVRWTAASRDGHIERGRFSFTILEPEPTPTPLPTAETPTPTTATATPTAETPTAAPTQPPSPTPAATPAPGNDDPAAAEAVVPIIAALALVALLGVFLVRSRGRSTTRS